MTEPLPAETSGPRSSQIPCAAAAGASPAAIRRKARPVRVPTSGGSERNHARWRSSTSAASSPPLAASERIRFRAIAVSSVVEPGGSPQPRPLERRDRVGHVAGPQELEGGSERVPEREPEGAAHDAIGEVHGAAEPTSGAVTAGRLAGRLAASHPVRALTDRTLTPPLERPPPLRPDRRARPAPPGPLVTFLVAMNKVGPRHRMCRRAGVALCGRPNCPSAKRPYPPGMHGRGRKRISDTRSACSRSRSCATSTGSASVRCAPTTSARAARAPSPARS